MDNDQWFQADAQQREHLLTSMIKRGDIAAYLLVKQFVEGNFAAGVQEVSLSDDALDFSTQGDGLTEAMIDQLEQIKTDIAEGRIEVPTQPHGQLLFLDPLPEGFDMAFANVSDEQISVYFGWLQANHTAAAADACDAGTINLCGQFMLDHLDDWLITTN